MIVPGDDPIVDANVLIQAGHNNPSAIAFLNANTGLLSFGRTARYEFLKRGTQAQLTAVSQQHTIVFDDAVDYRDVMAEAKRLREAIRIADANSGNARVLGVMDSRHLATSRLTGIDFVTNDLQLFKRGKDLQINVNFVDLSGGTSRKAQLALRYVPKIVTIP